jgi:hypothetical protein
MLIDIYFNKLASQKRDKSTKPIVSGSSKQPIVIKKLTDNKDRFPFVPSIRLKDRIKMMNHKPDMITRYREGDEETGISSEITPAPARRSYLLIDEWFENYLEKKARSKSANNSCLI